MATIPSGKWIKVSDPRTPVSEVARHALELRLDRVWHYLQLAATQPDEDVEYVHQTRVSSRRAVAAVDLFREVLPRKKSRWVARRLKKIRRSAGPARDDDVLIPRLSRLAVGDSKNGESRNGVADLVADVRRHRRRVQKEIVDIHEHLVDRDFPDRARALLERVEWRGAGDEPPFAEAASTTLRPVLDEFFTAAAEDLEDPEHMHALRIAGKRLRYTMEVFAEALDPDFRRELYPKVEKLQGLLGEVNDHHAAGVRFRRWRREIVNGSARATVGRMIDVEKAAYVRSQWEFHQWWTPDRREALRRDFDRFV